MTRFIISRAHEVYQALPLAAEQYVCSKCGLRGPLKMLFGDRRCSPTIYERHSGWVDQATPQERKSLDELV